jgi:AhpD family alkylhydroperoxidase
MDQHDLPSRTQPRLPPVARSQLSPYAAGIFDNVGPGGPANLVATLAHQPALFDAYLPVTIALQNGTLSSRLRELCILRLSHILRCGYIWHQHARIAIRCGVTEQEIHHLQAAPTEPPWTLTELALLTAVGELVETASIGSATWSTLHDHLSDAQITEFPVLIGHYSGLAYLSNSSGVAIDL